MVSQSFGAHRRDTDPERDWGRAKRFVVDQNQVKGRSDKVPDHSCQGGSITSCGFQYFFWEYLLK